MCSNKINVINIDCTIYLTGYCHRPNVKKTKQVFIHIFRGKESNVLKIPTCLNLSEITKMYEILDDVMPLCFQF